MTHRIVWKWIYIGIMLCAAIAASGQTFAVLVDFNLSDGAQPFYMSLAQGLDGNFYGTTGDGGSNGTGTIFKVTPGGILTTLHKPCPQPSCPHGDGFSSGVVLAGDGNFYGIADSGGLYNYGAIYKITPGGTLTTLHSFNGTDGVGGYPALIEGAGGPLWGATPGGGASGSGSVFKITLNGGFTTVYSFCSQPNCADGAAPFGGLVQGWDGNFYGTTTLGGNNNYGTVFKLTPTGTLTTLYSFCSQANCSDGYSPHAALVVGEDRNLYGTTTTGGIGGGTVFEIAPEGALTTLYRFCASCTAGGLPLSGLIQGTDGTFYGTTVPVLGSVHAFGTIFRITRNGKITFLHTFNEFDGSTPYGGLLQATDGKFYGTTTYGGPGIGAYGTIFRLSEGLPPFVASLPTVGKVMETVKILGTNLTGASGVTFNGVPADFAVLSETEISSTVPVGASTGKIQVTTPAGTLLSNVTFHVTP